MDGQSNVELNGESHSDSSSDFCPEPGEAVRFAGLQGRPARNTPALRNAWDAAVQGHMRTEFRSASAEFDEKQLSCAGG